ncbi:MAG: hypothetical protein ACTHN7_10880 [Solirubrobacterales bacterium]
MSKGALLALAGTIAAIALVGGGCGGGGGDSTSAVTKVQYVNKVDALCEEREKERSQKFNAVASKLKPGEVLSHAKQARMIETIIFPSYEKMIKNVKSLEAPAGDEAEIEELIKAMEKAQKKLEADPRQAVTSTVMFEEADALARKYGLEHCVI